jgi:putative sterol carrier protein
MATAAEVRAALDDYVGRCNQNERLRKMLRSWTRVIHMSASDSGDGWTMRVDNGEVVAIDDGLVETPDLVITATSTDFEEMFWGELNPAGEYVNGRFAVQGSQDDVMRLDAMAMVVWLQK